MPTRIRPAGLGDASAWAEVVAAASPYLVQDAASTRHEMATDPSDAVRLVAESDGQVVGIARLRSYDDEPHAWIQVMVQPDHRHRGIGSALLASLPLADSGKEVVHTIVEDDAESRTASQAWGFKLTRTFRMSAVDPTTVDPPPPDPRLVTLDQVDPQEVHALHNAIVNDDPSGLSLQLSWEEWLEDWQDPRNRPHLSHAVADGERLVSFTQLGSAGDRAWSNMTGTLPGYRGQGLAMLTKQHTLVAAARAGIARCFAGNDGDNMPMVAVNTRLGYRPFANPRLGVRPR